MVADTTIQGTFVTSQAQITSCFSEDWMVFVNCSHADRLGPQAGSQGLSKVTTQKQLIYHQKRKKSRKCPNFLRERKRDREREFKKMRGWTTSEVKKIKNLMKRFGQRPSVIYNF